MAEHEHDHPVVERLADLVGASAYGSVVVLAALVAVEPEDLDSAAGLELIAGAGLATFVAHFFAAVLVAQLGDDGRSRAEVAREAAADGSPIILLTLLPAVAIALGRGGVLSHDAALATAVAIGFVQLVAVGLLVGTVGPAMNNRWLAAAGIAVFGAAVVVLKYTLAH